MERPVRAVGSQPLGQLGAPFPRGVQVGGERVLEVGVPCGDLLPTHSPVGAQCRGQVSHGRGQQGAGVALGQGVLAPLLRFVCVVGEAACEAADGDSAMFQRDQSFPQRHH